MQPGPRWLLLPDNLHAIRGICDEFMSKNERNARAELNIYEISTPQHKGRQGLACHARNIEYCQQNVRTPETLLACLDYICQEYLGYYAQILEQEKERKRFQHFLYDRVKSIRCELYIQAMFEPRLALRLIKIMLFLDVMMEQKIELVGLEYFFLPEIKSQLLSEDTTKGYFQQALELAIFSDSQQKLLALLDENLGQITENQQLYSSLQTRLKIINRNYYAHLSTLCTHRNPYVKLLLWSQMQAIRDLTLSRYRKAKINERAGFLCRLLGCRKMEGWLNVSNREDMAKLEASKGEFDLEIGLWVPLRQLTAVLLQLSGLDQIANRDI